MVGKDPEVALPERLQIWKARIELESKGKYEEAKKVYDSILEKQETNKVIILMYVHLYLSELLYSLVGYDSSHCNWKG